MPAGLITGLRGVDLGVPDVDAHARFYTDTWRLTIAAERNGSAVMVSPSPIRKAGNCA